LDVNGQIKISGGSPAPGRVLTSDSDGLAIWQDPIAGLDNDWNISGNDMTNVNSGNVAIGTANASQSKLTVEQTTNIGNTILATGNSTDIKGHVILSKAENAEHHFAIAAVRGEADQSGHNGYGGYFSGGWHGVYGTSTAPGFNSRFGVKGRAAGTKGTCYGVFGVAHGTGINYGVYASGDIAHTGSLVTISDAQLKTDIKPIKSALTIISKLQPKTYRHKTGEFNFMHLAEGQQFGFIAQELESVLPDLVTDFSHPRSNEQNERDDELMFKGVKYIGLIPILTQGMKEQQHQLEKKNAEIEMLKSDNEEIKQRLLALEKNFADNQLKSDELGKNEEAPKSSLGQNIPNPMNNTTFIPYFLLNRMDAAFIVVVDIKGNEVFRKQITQNGMGNIEVDLSDFNPGTFIYSLVIDGKKVDTKQLILLGQ
jgi:hypothetical protein